MIQCSRKNSQITKLCQAKNVEITNCFKATSFNEFADHLFILRGDCGAQTRFVGEARRGSKFSWVFTQIFKFF